MRSYVSIVKIKFLKPWRGRSPKDDMPWTDSAQTGGRRCWSLYLVRCVLCLVHITTEACLQTDTDQECEITWEENCRKKNENSTSKNNGFWGYNWGYWGKSLIFCQGDELSACSVLWKKCHSKPDWTMLQTLGELNFIRQDSILLIKHRLLNAYYDFILHVTLYFQYSHLLLLESLYFAKYICPCFHYKNIQMMRVKRSGDLKESWETGGYCVLGSS